MPVSNRRSSRRDFLKLSGGALGLGALSFYAGFSSKPEKLPIVSATPSAYVDDFSPLPVFRAPYRQQQVNMAAFVFPAALEKLTAVCQRYLNDPTRGELNYVPLMGSLVMTYAEMLISSQDPRDSGVGQLRETELAFWIPTLAMRNVGGVYVPQHLAWFLPTLFVDDGCAIASGREVYGFNKQWGQFQRPKSVQDPELITSVMGFDKFSPSGQAEMRTLMQVRRKAGSVGSSSDRPGWTDWQGARAELSGELLSRLKVDGPATALVEAAARLVTDPMPLVFLKQFRDAVDSRQACYQAVIEAPIRVNQFSAGGFLQSAYQMELTELESHPIANTLGLSAGPQTARLGVWMQLGFDLDPGVEVIRIV